MLLRAHGQSREQRLFLSGSLGTQKSWVKLEHLLAGSAACIGIFQPLRGASAAPTASHGTQLAKTHIIEEEEAEVKECLKSWALELCPATCRAQSRMMELCL